MPGKKSSKNESSDETTEDADTGGGKGKLLPAIVLSVGLLGAGYFVGGAMGGGSGSAPVAEAADAEEMTDEDHTLGTLVSLEAINVNLADGHFLRIAVSMELSEEKSEYVASKVKKDKTYTFPVAPAADLLLTTFSGRSMDELSSSDGRDAARLAYAEAIDGVYHGDVIAVYFTEFVMQ